ncbi:MAG: D-aminoacyl-tRNA deacylase [Lachnospiraceae bacterium]|nr:D-aminoacyl-tRNA deacylase [Lachnospiraceae bacterium]MDD7628231.1 D-aminoacyl-tRNA deacylase [Lachnospiraceae bacterium]MDY4118220.1 D-aminoacyl-tRNA deacylase [Lachnospiraceae bacterium]
MKFIVQRVSEANVCVDNQIIGEIKKGFLVLVGVSNTDTKEIADKMVSKLIHLRIFEDSDEKTNLDIKSVNGELLIISQFTLYADCKHGNRPSFINAGNPELANELYEYIISKCKEEVPVVQHGEFGAHMKVSLINDGPFTIVLDSDEIIK